MSFPWDASRRAFADAADWFVRTTEQDARTGTMGR
ncbi:hypothetical protein F4561_002921 [Lipingzhangella halophila]|uniref:Uncharacterized protein n=1 Tax=Lipingzhangella halophila TaxID=1783352 RepID=A0A7W7W2U2_9ACTN|nr:hypothetical protein [Lipingzhangella halophila]